MKRFEVKFDGFNIDNCAAACWVQLIFKVLKFNDERSAENKHFKK